MNVLVVGSGGREHALCWGLAASPLVDTLYCAPGNAGIALDVHTRPLDVTNAAAITAIAQDLAADLVVIGPEVPLAHGAADAVTAAGIACFGPLKSAAMIEEIGRAHV